MPISSSAVGLEFTPTPFYTHVLKSGEPIESVRSQFGTDLSTINEIPSTTTPSTNSKWIVIGTTLLIVVLVGAAIAIPLGIILSKSDASTASSTLTTSSAGTTTSANVSSTTTRTTTSTSTSTTSTSTTTGASLTCSTNETVYAVWNTTAGGNALLATVGTGVGNFYTGETPGNVCDNNYADKYTNFGTCTSASSSVTCGLNTGFYRTPQRGVSLLVGFQICTCSSLPNRDPTAITLEGSNQPVSALTLGSSWTLIYRGPSGLATDPGRSACGAPQLFLSNTVWYTSYRLLVTSKRGADSCASYAEVVFIGY